MGHLASIQNMFEKVGVPSGVIATVGEVNGARALVVPSLEFDNAMRRVSMGLRGPLEEAALFQKIPAPVFVWVCTS